MRKTWVRCPRLGRSPGEGNSCPFQYSGLENSRDCIVHGVAKSWTWLREFTFIFTFIRLVLIPPEVKGEQTTMYVINYSIYFKICFIVELWKASIHIYTYKYMYIYVFWIRIGAGENKTKCDNFGKWVYWTRNSFPQVFSMLSFIKNCNF